jgi:hypothetical protein
MIVSGDALKVLQFLGVTDIRIDVPSIAFMLPDVACNRRSFIFAYKLIASTMLNVEFCNLLKAYFS